MSVNASGGFLRVTSDLLRHVEVYYRGSLVRRFVLNYSEGAFSKTLLQSVGQAGSDGVVFASHTFDYYDDVRAGGGDYEGFEPSSTWNTGDDKVAATTGRVALRYGPLIYCAESVDQDIDNILELNAALSTEWRENFLGGVTVIKGSWADGSRLLAIPYYARSNRSEEDDRRSRGRDKLISSVWLKDR